jgi:hypothetical protein
VIDHFVDIGGKVDHRCSKFLFITSFFVCIINTHNKIQVELDFDNHAFLLSYFIFLYYRYIYFKVFFHFDKAIFKSLVWYEHITKCIIDFFMCNYGILYWCHWLNKYTIYVC